ncbi:MAG: hypothetical protein ACOYL5_01140 [Phototrophicaceae bacterium]|jgi:Tol biopolymer transport system component
MKVFNIILMLIVLSNLGNLSHSLPDCARQAPTLGDHYGIAYFGVEATYNETEIEIHLNIWRSDTQTISTVLPDDINQRSGSVSFSPDGRYVAFNARNRQVAVANLETGLIQQVTDVYIDLAGTGARVRENYWSPVGGDIVIETREGWFLVQCNGENWRPIPGRFIQWSDDGTLLVVVLDDENETLTLVDANSLEIVKRLTSTLDMQGYVLSPDNKTLAFQRTVDNELNTYLLDVDTQTVQTLLENQQVGELYSGSPNGDFLLYRLDLGGVPLGHYVIYGLQPLDGDLRFTESVKILLAEWLPNNSGLVGSSLEEIEIPDPEISGSVDYLYLNQLYFIPLDCFVSQGECSMDDFTRIEGVQMFDLYYDIISIPAGGS